MESQPQNPEFRNNPESFHPLVCIFNQFQKHNAGKFIMLFCQLLTFFKIIFFSKNSVRKTIRLSNSFDPDSVGPGPKVIKLFSCSTQLSTKFILLINVKMLTIVGILTVINGINTTSAKNFFTFQYFIFYALKFRAQLSRV